MSGAAVNIHTGSVWKRGKIVCTLITVSSSGVDSVDGTKASVVVKYLTYCGIRRCCEVWKRRKEENSM